MLRRTVCLLHNNAPVHKTTIEQAAVKDCSFVELTYPPYSPDLAPAIIICSPIPRNTFEEENSSDEEVQEAVLDHFVDKTLEYFPKGIKMLISISEKCIEIHGDYIEK